jgi:hypothetical protein
MPSLAAGLIGNRARVKQKIAILRVSTRPLSMSAGNEPQVESNLPTRIRRSLTATLTAPTPITILGSGGGRVSAQAQTPQTVMEQRER